MAMEAKESPSIPEGVLISKDDFLSFNKTSDNMVKTLDAIKKAVERRAVIYMQHNEKQLQSQEVELDFERKKEDITKKIEILKDSVQGKKSQLLKIENSYLDLKKKVKYETESNNELRNKVKQLEYESHQKCEKFYRTAELYKTVISRYKDFLDICIDLDKENFNIATIQFRNTKKNCGERPFIKLEIINENKVKVLQTAPFNEENSEKILLHHEIILFVNRFQQQLYES